MAIAAKWWALAILADLDAAEKRQALRVESGDCIFVYTGLQKREAVEGPENLGQRVGIMPDGQGLASSAKGMDHMVRTFSRLTAVPIHEVIRMATLTPARIIDVDHEIGSLEIGKRADMLLLDRDLRVARVMRGGEFV